MTLSATLTSCFCTDERELWQGDRTYSSSKFHIYRWKTPFWTTEYKRNMGMLPCGQCCRNVKHIVSDAWIGRTCTDDGFQSCFCFKNDKLEVFVLVLVLVPLIAVPSPAIDDIWVELWWLSWRYDRRLSELSALHRRLVCSVLPVYVDVSFLCVLRFFSAEASFCVRVSFFVSFYVSFESKET